MDTVRCDVVVVGAGLAGLTAAAVLTRRGVDVRVVEARNDVGGRVRSVSTAAGVMELGGQFVGPPHRRMRSLVAFLGLTLQPSGLLARPPLWRLPAGHATRWLPPLRPRDLLRLAGALADARRHAGQMRPIAPWDGHDARDLDRSSLAAWLARRGVSADGTSALDAIVGGFATASSTRLSALQLPWWVARAGGMASALVTGMRWQIAEGAQAIAHGLARRLAAPVHLNTVAQAIDHSDTHVAVHTGHGTVFVADATVVAVPLPAYDHMTFTPALTAAHERALRHLQFGDATKVTAIARRAPSPAHRTVLGGAPLQIAWRHQRQLAGIAHSPTADVDDAALIHDLATAFRLERHELADHRILRWTHEPFVGGSYVVFGPGDIAQHAPDLASRQDRVHFAAAERSSWPMFMEGAVESGANAAHTILADLQ